MRRCSRQVWSCCQPRAPAVRLGQWVVLTTPDADRTFMSYLGSSHPLELTPEAEEAISSTRLLIIEGYLWEMKVCSAACSPCVCIARVGCGYCVCGQSGYCRRSSIPTFAASIQITHLDKDTRPRIAFSAICHNPVTYPSICKAYQGSMGIPWHRCWVHIACAYWALNRLFLSAGCQQGDQPGHQRSARQWRHSGADDGRPWLGGSPQGRDLGADQCRLSRPLICQPVSPVSLYGLLASKIDACLCRSDGHVAIPLNCKASGTEVLCRIVGADGLKCLQRGGGAAAWPASDSCRGSTRAGFSL